MLQDGGGQVQTTQVQWRKQQLQMHKQKQQQIIHQHRAAPAVCCHVRHGQTAISRTEESSAAQPECQLGTTSSAPATHNPGQLVRLR